MARLYTKENFPLPAVVELRRLGHDVLTSLDAGNAGRGISDHAVLQFAIANNRAVVTLNRRHFVRLHIQVPVHRGIILCTFDLEFAGLAARIDAAIRPLATLDGVLLRIQRPN